MVKESKRIREEFGLQSEIDAVREYSSLNKDFMYLNYPLIADEIISRLNLEKCFILDVGTGLGSLAREFAGRLPQSYVYGIDVSEEMLNEAIKDAQLEGISNLELILSDVHSLAFEDNFFDVVVSFGVLHHLSDIRVAFSEIKRVLKEGGNAFIYDLRKDAPPHIVSEIANQMPSSHKIAFLESVKEAPDVSSVEDVVRGLNVSQYSQCYPEFSRTTIVKNKDMLKEFRFLGKRFNKVSVQIHIQK
jgi:ubiquinone/menaquinone biosynthesis C-methylase UbiE